MMPSSRMQMGEIKSNRAFSERLIRLDIFSYIGCVISERNGFLFMCYF